MPENKKTTNTIILASPGWELVTYYGPADGAFLEYEPIIAWDIEWSEGIYGPRSAYPGQRWVTREATPIVVNNIRVDSPTNIWLVKRPDGKFDLPGDTTLDTEADVLAFYARQEAEQTSAA